MPSPFRFNKKTRKRLRKRSQQDSAWADKRELPRTTPPASISAMRGLAEINAGLAQTKRRKRGKRAGA